MSAGLRAHEPAPAPAERDAAVQGRAPGDADRERMRWSAAWMDRSVGRPLEGDVRTAMEAAFGHDFGRVRVHDDHAAHRAARALDAEAFTRGERVYFAAGRYRPSTADGKRLLAHELTHTLQQPPGSPRPVVRMSRAAGRATDLLEREAESAARRVAAGLRVPRGMVTVAAPHLRPPPSTLAARPARPRGAVAPPAQVRSLAEEVYRILLLDPADHSGAGQRVLQAATPATRDAVIGAVRARLTPAERARMGVALTTLATEPESAAAAAPVPVPDAAPTTAGSGAGTDAPRADSAPAAGSSSASDTRSQAPTQAPGSPAPAPSPATAAQATGTAESTAPPAEEAAVPKPLSTRLMEMLARIVGVGRRTGPQAPDVTPEDAPQPAPAATATTPPGSPPAAAPSGPAAAQSPESDAAPGAAGQSAEAAAAQAPPIAGEVPQAAPEGQSAAPAGPGAPEPAARGVGAPATESDTAAASPGGASAAAGGANANTAAVDEVEAQVVEQDRAEAERGEEARREEEPEAAGEAPPAAEAAPGAAGGEAGAGEAESGPAAAHAEAAETAAASGQPPPPVPEETGGEPAPASETAAPAPAEPAPAETAEPEAEAAPEAESASEAEGGEGAASPEAGTAAAPDGAAPPDAGGGDEAAPDAAESPAPAETPAEASAPAADAGGAAGDGTTGTGGGSPELAEVSAAGGDSESDGDAGGGGGGGGGGGSAVPEPEAPAAPDLSGGDPVDAMGQAASLPVGQMDGALGGVATAASASVQGQRSELAANPPQMESPTGAPSPEEQAAEAAEERGGAAAERVERTPEGAAAPAVAPAPAPTLPPAPARNATAPQVGTGQQGELSAEDARAMQASIRALPTRDPGLEVDAGPAPRLVLEGNADPARAQEQRAELNRSAAAVHTQGLRDAARPAGEDRIYPTVPRETLRAEVGGSGGGGGAATATASGGGGASAGGPGAGGAAVGATDPAAIIAESERGPQVRAAAAAAQGQMQAARADHDQRTAQARRESQEQIDGAVRGSAGEQRGVRTEARRQVRDQRRQWVEGQRAAVDDAHRQADAAGQEGARAIGTAAARGRAESAGHLAEGNRQVAQTRAAAEGEAAAARRRGEQQSTGILGWVARRATAFFNEIRDAVHAAFQRARERVRSFIATAQRLAAAAIDAARQAVVAAIRAAGAVLIAVGNTLLAGFPTLRDRFRGAIERGVQAAERRVNELADRLKRGVKRFLDLLGRGLDLLLRGLEAGLNAAINAARAAVRGALEFARGVMQALGQFAGLIRDIAAGPGQWLRNLGAAVVDGIRNHLWRTLKAAVKSWFNTKVEELLGLGAALWNVLRRGGISLRQVGRMLWRGILAALPAILIGLLIEKLVSMIVPAAGAVLAIVQGLQAAWGTISRIIAAISAFWTFLRAVKGGNAGPQFATALVAGAVVLIEFVALWLLVRLRRPAGAVAGRIRSIAQSIMARLRRVMQRVGRAIRRVGRALRRVGRRIVRAARRLGRRIRRGFRRLRTRLFGRRRGRRSSAQRRQRREQRRRERERRRDQRRRDHQARARRETAAELTRILSRRIPRILLRLHLLRLKMRWRWRTLRMVPQQGGDRFAIVGGFSPEVDLFLGTTILTVVNTMVTVQAPAQNSGNVGDRYAAAIRPYVRGTWAPEQYGPTGFEITAPGTSRQNLPSRLDRVRVKQERGHRVGSRMRVPDYSAEVFGLNAAGLREDTPSLVQAVEVTVVTRFEDGNQVGGAHKVDQFLYTLELLTTKYPTARLTYTFIAPGAPSQATRDYIERLVNNTGLASRVRVAWRVVGW